MSKKHERNVLLLGLAFTIASAVFTTWTADMYFFDDLRLQPFLFDAGIDCVGSLVCAALYYGCMNQEGDGGKIFRTLIVIVSACFSVNLAMYFTNGSPELDEGMFALCLFSKLFDLLLIYYFYQYVRITLDFKGKLADWANKWVPIMLAAENLIIIANIFYPVTYWVSPEGVYQYTKVSWIEDIFLLVASVVTTILIVKSENARSQKVAALTFLLFPVLVYVMMEGEFGNAAQYGAVLMSLVIVYCVIFNYNSGKLAATQTELDMATEIQESMLPSIFPPFPEKEEFDLYASMTPAKEVGGDFYDFYMIDDDHLGIVIADVSGKGVPAALFMMIAKTIIQDAAMLNVSASEVLNRTNGSLCAQNKMEMFVTAWVGILELSTGKLNCANAGHEYPALYHDG